MEESFGIIVILAFNVMSPATMGIEAGFSRMKFGIASVKVDGGWSKDPLTRNRIKDHSIY